MTAIIAISLTKMKENYNSRGYKGYDVEIEGYECQLFETPQGRCSIGVPMGDTPEDKAMFDKLVYYNKPVYHADSKEKVIEQVAEFIKDYKNKNEGATK